LTRKSWAAFCETRWVAYLVLGLHVAALCGLIVTGAVSAVQPETGLWWDVRTGKVLEIATEGPGTRAGLHVGDQILAVDGLPPQALPNLAAGKRAGEVLSVTVLRKGKTRAFSLALERPPAWSLFDRLIPIGVGIGFGVVGLLTYLLAQRQPLAGHFSLVCLAAAGVLAGGTLSTFGIPLGSRLFGLCLSLIAALGLSFHLRFPRVWAGPAVLWLVRCTYGVVLLLCLFFLLPGWTRWYREPWYAVLGWGLRLLLVLSLGEQIALLLAATRSDERRARRHARLLVTGVALGLAPLLLVALLPSLLTGRPWWPYQYTFPFLLTVPLAYGYTLVRARLSHWDRAAARLIAAAAAAILLLGAYGLVVQHKALSAPWLSAPLALVAGLAFWPLARVARRWSDRVLFDKRYDYAGVVSDLGDRLARALERSTLRHLLVERLPEVMPFEGAALLLAREEDSGWDLQLEPPSTLVAKVCPALPGEGTLAHVLVHQPDPVPAAELRRLLTGDHPSPAEAAWLQNDGVETWVPLAREGRLLGILLLGPRTGNDLLDGQDHRILRSLAHEAALAAENVRLADALRRLAQRVTLAQEEERQRLSRALHDEAGQALTALKISLELIRGDLPAEGASLRQRMADAAALTDATMQQIHLLAQNLRPPTLDTVGLDPALDGFCRSFARRTRLTIDYRGAELPLMLDAISTCLYRFLQEALANVAKHAQADRVRVVLRCDGETVSLSVEDDGRGFDHASTFSPSGWPVGIGLMGMEERLKSLGGRLEVDSAPGRGTRLTAHIPL
jgi:signal transduction histidine kinase